ncbi:MAG: ferredoxin reductase [Actinomycetota bacterium]|nr:ferredoxin reductase [Actinomycetota bacterium]
MYTEIASEPRRLSHRVLRSGLIEALAAPHGVDRYLELVRPSWSLSELRAEVTAVHHPAPGSVTLTLRPNHLWRGFEAGQFVRCTVEVNGSRRSRCYSPASSAHRRDGQIEVTARAHPHGLVSRFLHDRATRGMIVGLEPAAGDFILPAERPADIALISGGSGITPVMSILRTLLDEGHRGRVAFLHYARTPDHVPYARELAAISALAPNVSVGFEYTRAVSTGRLNHFERAHLTALGGDLAAPETYVCGPPGLIDAVHAAGDPERVHSESFIPPALVLDTGDAVGTVSFARSGVDAPNTGTPLLEQAEVAGLKPVHGCRMGICHTCTCRKLAGQVRNVLTGEVSVAEDVDIQICVSVPAGSVALDL